MISWWFLETDSGEWLENEAHGTLTRDPNSALKWPNQTAADDFRRHLRHPWWALKATEHKWIAPAVTQVPVFDPEAVARIIDPDIWKSVDYRVLAVSRAKVAAIMALHAADPDRQMADAEAALWRDHDARHAAELSRLKDAKP